MAKPFIVYGRPGCEDTERARAFLDHRGVKYDYVNIEEDQDAEEFVVLYNDGDRVTPTIVMGLEDDRMILSEPTNEELDNALNAIGFEDPRQEHRF